MQTEFINLRQFFIRFLQAIIDFIRRKLRDRLVVSLILATTTFSVVTEATAEILVGTGDTIRVAISGLPLSRTEARVDIDGYLNLAWFGRIKAADRSIPDILNDVQQMAAGRIIKRYTTEGVLSLIQLSAEDVYLEVIEYQSVIVSGDVARPGEMAFRLNLTARGAIAIAGGARSSFLTGVTVTDPAQIIRWQNEYSSAALDHAAALVRLWRTTAEIDLNYDAEAPGIDQVAVSSEVLGMLMNEQVLLMNSTRKNEDGDRLFLATSLEQVRKRSEILILQKEKQAEVFAFDEEDEARVQALFERGLVPVSQLTDIRRNTVLSATRLLDLEENLSRFDLDTIRLQRQLDEYEEVRLAALLFERVQVNKNVLDARLRMDLLLQNLSGISAEAGGTDVLTDLGVTVIVYRRTGGQLETFQLDLDSTIYPGDTLEITMEPPTAYEIEAK